MSLLEIDHLTLDLISRDRVIRALDDLSLTVEAGEIVGLVGESGCGKSVAALSIARLLPSPPARYVAGSIRLEGREVLGLAPAELRRVRGGLVSYVFQEPGSSLNPVMRIGDQIKEALRLHRPEKSSDQEVVRLLRLTRIPAPETRVRQFPFELSGGMQQRVMIAMALASEPKLLVADEPTTALDVTTQAQILDLLQDLRRGLGMSLLLITHNLAMMGRLADRVAVMYSGQIVETAPTRDLLRHPLHPYTCALLAAVPRLGAGVKRLASIPGTVPRGDRPPVGCRFAPRCARAREGCARQPPEWTEAEPQRWVRCPYGGETM